MPISIQTSFDNVTLKRPDFISAPFIKYSARAYKYIESQNAYNYESKVVIGFPDGLSFVDEVYFEVWEDNRLLTTITHLEDFEILYYGREEYFNLHRIYVLNGYYRVSHFKKVYKDIIVHAYYNRASNYNICSRSNIVTDVYPNVFAAGEWYIDDETKAVTGIDNNTVFFRLYSAISHNDRKTAILTASIVDGLILYPLVVDVSDTSSEQCNYYFDKELTSSSYILPTWTTTFANILQNKYLDIKFVVEYTNSNNTIEVYDITKRINLEEN